MKTIALVLFALAVQLTAQEGPGQRVQETFSLVINNAIELAATGSLVADSFTEITARLDMVLDNSTRSFGDNFARLEGAVRMDNERDLTLLPYGGQDANDKEKRPRQGLNLLQWRNRE